MPDPRPLLNLYHSRRLWIRVEWEPRDLWVGVYWTMDRWPVYYLPGNILTGYGRRLHLYVCILPLLPLHVSVYLGESDA